MRASASACRVLIVKDSERALTATSAQHVEYLLTASLRKEIKVAQLRHKTIAA
jgi:hypothetical protein